MCGLEWGSGPPPEKRAGEGGRAGEAGGGGEAGSGREGGRWEGCYRFIGVSWPVAAISYHVGGGRNAEAMKGIRHTSGISGGFRQLRIYVMSIC